MKQIAKILIYLWFAAALGAQDREQSGRTSFSVKSVPPPDLTEALSEMNRAFENLEEETLSPEDNYYLGRAVAAQILHTYKPYTGNPMLVSYVNKICQVIAINSPLPTAFNNYHVGILDTAEINAFATPGGHIFLTRGLVACIGSEDALAAVIAHELAHIQLRHAALIINDQRPVDDLSQTADRAAAIALRNVVPRERAAFFSENIRTMVNTLFRNGFAQDQEFEADITAVSLLRGAGYDPSALVTVLMTLQATQPLHPGGFNTTHPSPAARLANLAEVSLAGGGSATRRYRESRFAAIRGFGF
jgi:predicted Zn-dependent protease